MNKNLILQLGAIFIITQLIGLWVGFQLVQADLNVTIINENPEDPVNSLALIAYIIVMSGVLLLVIKFLKGKFIYWLFKAFESIAVFGAATIVFASFFDSILVIVPAAALIIARIVFSKNIWLRNAGTIIAVSGAGAVVGASLGVIPIIVFMTALAIYDIIAVFKTKHMITLAKAITKKNLSFTYALPTKEHQFELGAGDLVVPLAFAVSVLAESILLFKAPFYFIPPTAILFASLLGLLTTMDYVSKRVGKALPALPFQTALMLLAWGMLKISGF
jgi:presenilin-like A22 family membrane protease